MIYIRIVLIIAVCSLLFSSKESNDLSGTWIGSYYFDPNSTLGSKFPLNWLVEVSDDKLAVSTLLLDGVDPPNRSTSIKYRRKGDQIFVYFNNEVDSIAIVSKSDDSIVLQYHAEGELKFVFKKFKRGTSPKMPIFAGKSFLFCSENRNDSISFITDSMFINISHRLVRGRRWAATAVHDYRFLLLGEQSPPLYLKSIGNDTVTLENFGPGSKYIFLVRLDDKKLSIQGSWEEVGRLYKEEDLQPPGGGKMKLMFDRDSCQISYGTKLIKRRWRLNSTAEILYFDPIGKVNDRSWAWHVKKTGDSLIIDRRILIKPDAEDFDLAEKIIFKKRK